MTRTSVGGDGFFFSQYIYTRGNSYIMFVLLINHENIYQLLRYPYLWNRKPQHPKFKAYGTVTRFEMSLRLVVLFSLTSYFGLEETNRSVCITWLTKWFDVSRTITLSRKIINFKRRIVLLIFLTAEFRLPFIARKSSKIYHAK